MEKKIKKGKIRRKALIAAMVGITLLFSGTGFADVPAPPANQTLGMDDSISNDLVEADCRVCHEDPSVTGPTNNVDRHHILGVIGVSIPQGECSVNGNTCSSNAYCDAAICSATGPPPGVSCTIDDTCPDFNLGETCGEVCIGETVAPHPDSDYDGTPDATYGCLNCHTQSLVDGVITFDVPGDCMQCHIQIPGEGSVHHQTAMAQGTDSPLGDADKGDCTPCHGTLVDDIGDTHSIPTYDPSLVTPSPSGGNGLPVNSRGNGSGACNYCHDSGTDSASSVQVFNNSDTHHNIGLFLNDTGVPANNVCVWCHDLHGPAPIRGCEGCHGFSSLHNIALDSDDDGNTLGSIIVGSENAGYSHVGHNDDCLGCHGFVAPSSFAPGSGPVTPDISSADTTVVINGSDTAITLTGAAFTNIVSVPGLGDFEYSSNILLTAADGSTTTLTPDTISQGSLTVTIPGTTAPGNYDLQAVKYSSASRPVVITVIPKAVIDTVICDPSCTASTFTITGAGFGILPAEPEVGTYYEDINVSKLGVLMDVSSWTDTRIEGQIPGVGCNVNNPVTVNTLFDSASK